MRKVPILITLVLSLLLTGAVLAQTPAPVPATVTLPPFQAYIGVGQIATSTSGNAITYTTTFQTNLHAGFRFFPTKKFAVDMSYFHDNVRLGKWLVEHNFRQLIQGPIQGYEYSAFGVYAEYWPIRTASGGVFIFAGPQEFFGTGGISSKLGLAAGAGAQYHLLGGIFVESKVSFWHVQDFLVPVGNVYNASISIGYQF
jgi:opacity protein-like surface antigen